MRRIALTLAALLLAFVPPVSAQQVAARDWVHLNGKPLQHPFNPNVIWKAVHGMAYAFPTSDIADELAQKVINERGRQGTLCKGDTIAGMTFGHLEIWNGLVRVVWANVRENCKPITIWEAVREQVVYTAIRVHACKNLGALYPRCGPALPPSPGPILGLAPPAECPPYGGIAVCC